MWLWQYIPCGLSVVLLVCYLLIAGSETNIKSKWKPYLLVAGIIAAILTLVLVLCYANQ